MLFCRRPGSRDEPHSLPLCADRAPNLGGATLNGNPSFDGLRGRSSRVPLPCARRLQAPDLTAFDRERAECLVSSRAELMNERAVRKNLISVWSALFAFDETTSQRGASTARWTCHRRSRARRSPGY
jgi:hypothetical protein